MHDDYDDDDEKVVVADCMICTTQLTQMNRDRHSHMHETITNFQ